MLFRSIEACAFLRSQEDKDTFIKRVKKFDSVESWNDINRCEAFGFGFGAALPGLPWCVGTIGADLLLCIIRGIHVSLGNGVLMGHELDVEDVIGILGVWSGAFTAGSTLKMSIKTGAKFTPKIMGKTAGMAAPQLVTALMTKGQAKVIPKAELKAAMKFSTKFAAKVSSKVSTKVGTKVGAKAVSKGGSSILPILGGVLSGGINIIILNEIIDSAQRYYESDYLGLAENFFDGMRDLGDSLGI